jgi:hypothetical protein
MGISPFRIMPTTITGAGQSSKVLRRANGCNQIEKK